MDNYSQSSKGPYNNTDYHETVWKELNVPRKEIFGEGILLETLIASYAGISQAQNGAMFNQRKVQQSWQLVVNLRLDKSEIDHFLAFYMVNHPGLIVGDAQKSNEGFYVICMDVHIFHTQVLPELKKLNAKRTVEAAKSAPVPADVKAADAGGAGLSTAAAGAGAAAAGIKAKTAPTDYKAAAVIAAGQAPTFFQPPAAGPMAAKPDDNKEMFERMWKQHADMLENAISGVNIAMNKINRSLGYNYLHPVLEDKQIEYLRSVFREQLNTTAAAALKTLPADRAEIDPHLAKHCRAALMRTLQKAYQSKKIAPTSAVNIFLRMYVKDKLEAATKVKFDLYLRSEEGYFNEDIAKQYIFLECVGLHNFTTLLAYFWQQKSLEDKVKFGGHMRGGKRGADAFIQQPNTLAFAFDDFKLVLEHFKLEALYKEMIGHILGKDTLPEQLVADDTNTAAKKLSPG